MPEPHYLEAELYSLLRDKPEIIRFIEESSLDGLWYWDLEAPEHEWMSPSFWRTFGYEPDEKEHLASEWQGMINQDDLRGALENFTAHCEDPDVPYEQIVRYTHRDGSTVWVRCSGQVIRDEDGRPVRMLGAHTDITHVKRSEERLRAFVSSLPGLALILDEDGRYVDVMTTREGLLADQAESLLGLLVSEVLPEETSAQVMGAIAQALEWDDTVVIEYELNTVEGASIWFEGRVSPFPGGLASGKKTVIWLAHDITTRKQSELELRQKNEELRQFSYIAAHDLRSPAQAIEQVAGWLEDDLADVLDDSSRRHLELIQRRASRMQSLLQGLLEYSRTADRVQPTTVESLEVARAAVEIAGTDVSGFDVTFGDEFPRLKIDPVLLQLVIQNLVANAIKHHDRGEGTITVRGSALGETARFEVSDDGPGIDPRFHDRIFQIFQTLKSKDEVEASGVGLSIVKKAVEAMDGRIEIDSDGQSRGTTFRVIVPLEPKRRTTSDVIG